MTQHTTGSNDRGVSESIGFLLMFGIVITGIALVVLYGYPMLLQQQTSADEKIMEKNMIVLQNDFKSLAYKTVPFKETSMKIGGGSLTVFNSGHTPASTTIDIYDAGGTSYLPAPYNGGLPFTPGELRYESISSQTDISLQNGAVVMRRHIEPGSTMLAEPRWFFDPATNTMVINLFEITSTDMKAKEGIGTVQMELVGDPYYKESPVPTNGVVIIKCVFDSTQDYSVAWDDYIWNKWSIPATYKGSRFVTAGPPKDIQYTITNAGIPGGPSVMTLVVKIFKVNIRSL